MRRALALLTLLSAMSTGAEDWAWRPPPGLPAPLVPADQPVTTARVTFGAALFSDPRLSVTGAMSCATCHQPDRYFTDGKAMPLGALGDRLPFNTPTLLNVAYAASYGWTEPGVTDLDALHLRPLTSTAPVELGTGAAQLDALWADPERRRQARAAFGDIPRLELAQVSAALSSYVRTLVGTEGPLDRYLFYADSQALSGTARDGLALFLGPRLNCAACHRGPLLSGPTRSTRQQVAASFHHTGAGSAAAGGARFRTPALRYLRHTAPYMHDGSVADLEAVIDFYARGGGPAAVDLRPFTLTAAERAALLAFLRVL